MVGCLCAVCTSQDPYDFRLRTSLLLQTASGKTILVDASPDLRTQLLRWKVATIDGALITHDHADHLHGIDDLRPFCFGPPKKQIPIVVSDKIAPTLCQRFDYIFKADELFHQDRPILGGGIPLLKLMPQTLEDRQVSKICVAGELFQLFLLPHGHTFTTGLIHQSMAYIPDCQNVSSEILDYLEKCKLELLIIDCLQVAPHDTHLNVQMAFDYSKKIKAKKTRFIHMNHELSHQQLLTLASQHFNDQQALPAYDNEMLEY